MTQGKNKTPQTQAPQAPQAQVPTLGTLLATALGIAYGAWAVAQSCQAEWGNKAPCRRWRQNRAMAQILSQKPQAEVKAQSPSTQPK